MQLHGNFTVTVRDTQTDQIVFAEVYDTVHARDRALKDIAARYRTAASPNRYFVQSGMLSSHLPSLNRLPPDAIDSIAAHHAIPVELLQRAASVEEARRRQGVAGYAARHRDMLMAGLLAVAASILLYRARQLNAFADAWNETGAAAAAVFAVSLWFVYRYSQDRSHFAFIAVGLFIAALVLDGLFGPAFF